jgi:pimeloyl-ACP methyl ester carboxylesterase
MKIRAVVLGLGAAYFACCFVIATVLGEFALHPARVLIDRQPEARTMAAGFGAELKDVSIKAADDTQLQAWFARPKQANGNSIILLHGIGDNRQGMIGLARLFLSHGYSVLLPDSRGQGSSSGLPTYGIREEGDIQQWFGWLHTHENPRCIYGMGESMGAAILLQALKSTPFCAVVAESSFCNFREIAYIRVGQFFNTGSWLGRIALRPAVEFAFLYCRLKYGVWLSRISPEMSVVGSRVPILLIHGLSDNNIPIDQSEMIFEHCPANSSFWKVPNAGHCGAVNAAGPEFNSRVLSWFSSHEAHPEGGAARF